MNFYAHIQMSNIASTILHTTSQLGVSVLTGSIVDGVFPKPGATNNSYDTTAALELTAEVVAQIVANGLLVAGAFKLLRGLPKNYEDPTGGFAFLVGIIESQPNLLEKIHRLSNYSKNVIGVIETDLTGEVSHLSGYNKPKYVASKNIGDRANTGIGDPQLKNPVYQ